MTLEEIKDRIAEESLCRDWVTFINDQPNWKVEEIMDEVAKRYAQEAIKADRERIKQHHADELPEISFNDLAIELGKDIDNLPVELP